ncbi:serine hydrolase [Agrococcus sp. HG114]|uniref:serine hydrolase n=1 Tax=Agrococcus sp. HG114 TaxID=2969757 RepID=UPI00215B22FE|nr:serine hydrolase [Agrococcus sp. HG114]MCR8670296.1 serine hydrolase [Agrococcus sp. HG114]
MPSHDAIAHALDYADRWLAYRRWRLDIPGVQLAVRIGGELVRSSAHGVADEATGEPLTPEHRFRIASHSKSLAAIAAMRLVDDGILRLDDELRHHVPALEEAPAGALAVRELLSHGSGTVRDGDDIAFWHLAGDFPDEERLLAIATSAPAPLPASVEFKYSNIGFGLLGLVIEAVTGERYADALARLGYEPHPAGDRVELANCPFHALSREHTGLVCGMNEALLGGLVEALPRAGVRARLDPAPGRCCVVLERDASGPR